MIEKRVEAGVPAFAGAHCKISAPFLLDHLAALVFNANLVRAARY